LWFRPKKSTLDALSKNLIKLRGAGFTWVIQGNIEKCFYSIPHIIIRREIGKILGCPNIRSLIDKVIAYPINKDDNIIKNKIGNPQGTVYTPPPFCLFCFFLFVFPVS